MQHLSFHKTRIAPTPSGYLHLGNIYSFLLTSTLAAKAGAGILLRIDDLDRERFQLDYLEDIFSSLRFMNIRWTEGPRSAKEFREWSQSARMKLYNDALAELADKNLVYACSCSRAEAANGIKCECRRQNLSLRTQDCSWKLKTDESLELTVKTSIGSENALLTAGMKDFIVRRKDGMPAYQVASLLDDVYFKVDFIVRGNDLKDSTIAQLYLATLLGKNDFLQVVFLHHSLLNTSDGKKLSKSSGATSLKYLRDKNWSPERVKGKIEEMLKEHGNSLF